MRFHSAPVIRVGDAKPVQLGRAAAADGRWRLYAFAVDPSQDVFDLRGIDRDHGAIVVVRPDQYVSAVLPLDVHEAVDAFLEPVLLEPAPAELAAVG